MVETTSDPTFHSFIFGVSYTLEMCPWDFI